MIAPAIIAICAAALPQARGKASTPRVARSRNKSSKWDCFLPCVRLRNSAASLSKSGSASAASAWRRHGARPRSSGHAVRLGASVGQCTRYRSRRLLPCGGGWILKQALVERQRLPADFPRGRAHRFAEFEVLAANRKHERRRRRTERVGTGRKDRCRAHRVAGEGADPAPGATAEKTNGAGAATLASTKSARSRPTRSVACSGCN